MTHPLGKKTQTYKKPHSGVCKKNTLVKKNTEGLEFHVKTTFFSPIRVFYVNKKGEKMTQPLGKKTQTYKNQHSGVFKKNTSVTKNTEGLEYHVKTTFLLPMRVFYVNQKGGEMTHPLGKRTQTLTIMQMRALFVGERVQNMSQACEKTTTPPLPCR